jgi:hypothetical protein
MPTDAKCGLLVGVGLVLAAAVLFFQKDPSPADPPPAVGQPRSPAAAVKPPVAEPTRPPECSPVPGRPVSRSADDRP